MENRVLRYFVEMAKTQNMSRAAENLHVTQPTMSRQLKDLEQELGVKLFLRTNYRIRLTPAGTLFLNRALDILSLVDKTRAEFRQDQMPEGGDLYLGCPETDSMRQVARTVARLKQRKLEVCCHLHSGNAADVLDRLNRGLDDLILTVHRVEHEEYQQLELPLHDEWGVLLRHDHPLSARQDLCLEDLLSEPLIVAELCLQRVFPRWFSPRQLSELKIAATFNLAYNGSLFVREGLGIGVTFSKLIAPDKELTFRPLRGVPAANLYVVWRKNHPLTPQARLFLTAFLKELAVPCDLDFVL